MFLFSASLFFFFFNDTATTEIYTLSLHDALPIYDQRAVNGVRRARDQGNVALKPLRQGRVHRSEEHTSELQSHLNLVCRLLLEKKKKYTMVNKTLQVRLPDSFSHTNTLY